MKFIANILTDKKFTGNELYNVVNSKELLIPDIPTLVVGWEFTKSLYPDVDITDWVIDDNTYWTFGNREKRSVYEDRIEKFKNIAINYVISSVKYKFINILADKQSAKEFISKVDAESGITSYYYNGIVYVYIPSEGVVYGISLRDIDYVGNNPKTFLSQLNGKENVKSVTTDGVISPETKFAFNGNNYVMPYILS